MGSIHQATEPDAVVSQDRYESALVKITGAIARRKKLLESRGTEVSSSEENQNYLRSQDLNQKLDIKIYIEK